MELLGKEFDGVLGCDYFSAYRKFMKVLSIEVQFCLAHLIRDVKFLRDLPSVEDRDYGCLLLLRLKELFEVIHSREGMSESEFTKALKGAKANILEAAARAPSTRYSQNMAKRFANHGESYFTFITTPGLDPTNNVAERAFRFVVLDRVVTQGTRGESGRRWCERIWTTLATCNQRGISAFAFLRTAIGEWMEGRESPSLLGEELATS
jgi:transposase